MGYELEIRCLKRYQIWIIYLAYLMHIEKVKTMQNVFMLASCTFMLSLEMRKFYDESNFFDILLSEIVLKVELA